MVDVVDTAKVDAFLQHIAKAGSIDTGRSGGGKFDESMVKRDKGGKFSKLDQRRNMLDALDKEWLATLEDAMDSVSKEVQGDLEDMLQRLAAANGYDEIGKMFQNPDLLTEAEKQGAAIVNEAAKKSWVGVSPSGTKVVEMYVKPNAKKAEDSVGVRAVPFHGTNPHTLETQYSIEAYRNLRRAKRSGSTGHFRFNPRAQLDPSRVHDLGGTASPPNVSVTTVRHSDQLRVNAFLEHFGTKGMKWGVRKDGSGGSKDHSVFTTKGAKPKVGDTFPSGGQSHTVVRVSKGTTADGKHIVTTRPTSARSKVKSGTATLDQAHHAAIKTKGHRAANFVLGDKTYWKNTAGILGTGLTAFGIASIPGLLPAAAVAGVTSAIVTSANVANIGAQLTNSYRAFFGNSRINANMRRLHGELGRRQQDADARTQRILSKYGSLPKGKLHHGEPLIMHEERTVQQVWESLSSEQMDTMETIIGLSLDESNAEGVVVDTDVYNSMSPIQRDIATFVMAGAIANAERSSSMAQADQLRVDEFLEHFGRKGMRWGQHIFSRGSGSSSSSGDSAGTGDSASSKSSSSSTGINSVQDLKNLSDSQQAHAVALKAKKGGVASLSNQEVQILVNRLNLEAQYAKFKQQNSKLARGREFTNRQLKTGKTINDMIQFANSPAGKLVASVLLPSKGTHMVGTRAKNRVLNPKLKP